MGGTSCDVSVAAGGHAASSGGREVAGRPLALPMVDVHTVGAGGGSIAWRDAGGALRVGPHSAGADPGPACYGRGGTEPTVTDANLVLGYLAADSPLAGGVELDAEAGRRAVGELGESLGLDLEETADGIVRVAGAEMAGAVRVMTVERGIDPRDLALLAFGGAGPLHAAAVALELGMRRIVVPAASGVLSAVGLVVSERRRDLVESVLLRGDELTGEAVATAVGRLAERGRRELGEPEAEVSASYDLRYAGQAYELTVTGDPGPDPDRLRSDFRAAHEERYGFADDGAEVQLVTVRVRVAVPGGTLPEAAGHPDAGDRGTRPATFEGERVEARVFAGAPDGVEGPAICELAEATLVVPPGWSGSADPEGTITLERS
jgi:N-methylhydantoinase A